MGINIYVRRSGQTPDGQIRRFPLDLDLTIREAYHGEPYVTRFLFREAFETGEARIPAVTLRKRLPEALRLAEYRERTLYGESSPKAIQEVVDRYTAFVEFCERLAESTGEAVVTIVASY